MKLCFVPKASPIVAVAPLAGAWIEIFNESGVEALGYVAPLAGAWIEIVNH